MRNYSVAVAEWKGDVVFLRRIVPGPAPRSYGIQVARLAGVPAPVIERARQLLAQLEPASARGRGRGWAAAGGRRDGQLVALRRGRARLAPELAAIDVDRLAPTRRPRGPGAPRRRWPAAEFDCGGQLP